LNAYGGILNRYCNRANNRKRGGTRLKKRRAALEVNSGVEDAHNNLDERCNITRKWETWGRGGRAEGDREAQKDGRVAAANLGSGGRNLRRQRKSGASVGESGQLSK